VELNLHCQEAVHGHGLMIAAVTLIVQDYTAKRNELTTADVENAIVDRLTDAALMYLTDDEAAQVKEGVRYVYQQYRPSSQNAPNTDLFYRPLNILNLSCALIHAFAEVVKTENKPAAIKPAKEPEAAKEADDVKTEPVKAPNKPVNKKGGLGAIMSKGK